MFSAVFVALIAGLAAVGPNASYFPGLYCCSIFATHPLMLWASVVSDTAVAGAYIAIPIVLVLVSRRRKDIPFNWMFLEADVTRLHQVFWNVLRNCCKFTPEGGRISVRSYDPTPRTIAIETEGEIFLAIFAQHGAVKENDAGFPLLFAQ